MAGNTSIEWTDRTWNPCRGCTRVSPGCQNCYAERYSARFCGAGRPFEGVAVMTTSGPRWTNEIRLVEDAVDAPLRWRKPQTVFVNSMSDLFHEKIPLEFILRVFEVMVKASWHRFQVLTKRSERLLELSPHLPWAANIWMGVSVENTDYAFRIDDLRATNAMTKFLSLEPLLSPLSNISLQDVDWVIVGGESGPGARPMQAEWARDIRDQCQRANIPFFFKQFGHIRNNPDRRDPTAKQNGGSAKGGRMLEGRLWDEMPRAASTALPVLSFHAPPLRSARDA